MLLRILLALAFTTATMAAASADGMTAKQTAEARAKVQTAVALARIAKEINDGDAMLVAARLMASAGPVASGDAPDDGAAPPLFDVKQMAAEAKAMGADPKKADMLATQPVSHVSGGNKATGYWINTCDASGYCAWAWLD